VDPSRNFFPTGGTAPPTIRLRQMQDYAFLGPQFANSARSRKILDKTNALEQKREEELALANLGTNDNVTTIAAEEAEEVSQQFKRKFDLSKHTTLYNRLNDPGRQRREMVGLIPQRIRLMTRPSFRCPNKDCNTYLIKPDMAISQCKFDHEQLAMKTLPWMVLKPPKDDVVCYECNSVVLMMTNHTPSEMFIKIEPCTPQEDRFLNCEIDLEETDFIPVRPTENEDYFYATTSHFEREYHPGGHYTQDNTVGFYMEVKPQNFTAPVEFSIRCVMKTGIPQPNGTHKLQTINFKINLTLPPPSSGFNDQE